MNNPMLSFVHILCVRLRLLPRLLCIIGKQGTLFRPQNKKSDKAKVQMVEFKGNFYYMSTMA